MKIGIAAVLSSPYLGVIHNLGQAFGASSGVWTASPSHIYIHTYKHASVASDKLQAEPNRGQPG